MTLNNLGWEMEQFRAIEQQQQKLTESKGIPEDPFQDRASFQRAPVTLEQTSAFEYSNASPTTYKTQELVEEMGVVDPTCLSDDPPVNAPNFFLPHTSKYLTARVSWIQAEKPVQEGNSYRRLVVLTDLWTANDCARLGRPRGPLRVPG